jgi:hypothetical protein
VEEALWGSAGSVVRGEERRYAKKVWAMFCGGDGELQHRLDFLYNSNAIFCMSLMVGFSLGLLPLLLIISARGSRQIPNLFERESFHMVSNAEYVDHTLNRWWAWCMSKNSSLYYNSDSLYMMITGITHFWLYKETNKTTGFTTLQDWRASPQCWYSRHGKLPIFQYNLEDEV